MLKERLLNGSYTEKSDKKIFVSYNLNLKYFVLLLDESIKVELIRIYLQYKHTIHN